MGISFRQIVRVRLPSLHAFSFHSGIHSILFYPQVNNKRFHCVNLKQYGDVYIRHECADDWAYPNIKASAVQLDVSQK